MQFRNLKLYQKLYSAIFVIFIIAVVFLSKNATLVYEWQDIVGNYKPENGYRYKGVYSAYMPPLYPYFLLIFKNIIGGKYWIWLACIGQSLIFFISMLRAFFVFFPPNHSKKVILLFATVVLFPPILFGITKVSSFAFSVSFITLLIVEFYRWKGNSFRNLLFIGFLIFAGIYTRYEFWLLTLAMATILFFYKKISAKMLIGGCFLMFILYAPWCYRNYEKTGKFTYSTSLRYNFAKGNNANYDVFSSYNLPYDPATKQVLDDDFLYSTFKNEAQKEEYLSKLSQEFRKEHFSEFLELNLKKLAINFSQFFPDNNYFKNGFFPYFYSLLLLTISFLYFLSVRKLYKNGKKFDFLFNSVLYLFFLIVYQTAPLPRYFLFFLPFFLMIIGGNLFLNSKK